MSGCAAGASTTGSAAAQPASPPATAATDRPRLIRRNDPVTSVAARAVVTQRRRPASLGFPRVLDGEQRRRAAAARTGLLPRDRHRPLLAPGPDLHARRPQPGRHPGDDRPDDLRRGLDSHGPPAGEHHRAGEGREHGRLRRHRLARRLRVRPLRAARARRRDERPPQPVARAGRVAEPEGRGRERAAPAGVRRADHASPRRSARSSPTGSGSPNRPRRPRRPARPPRRAPAQGAECTLSATYSSALQRLRRLRPLQPARPDGDGDRRLRPFGHLAHRRLRATPTSTSSRAATPRVGGSPPRSDGPAARGRSEAPIRRLADSRSASGPNVSPSR